uniref:RNA polymerase II-associated protein 1 N-terminal domain-containing protein n=1 Tax=Setaria digitata TaxID=48799 RepID=A0A915PKS9_9BILA
MRHFLGGPLGVLVSFPRFHRGTSVLIQHNISLFRFQFESRFKMENMKLERPDAKDTEEDLLRMQEEMFKNKCKKQKISVISKYGKISDSNSFVEKGCKFDSLAGRFCLDLDALAEKETNVMELTVQEQNIGFLDNTDWPHDCSSSVGCEDYSKEDGFPDVLDLSGYYIGTNNGARNSPVDGRSFFAKEFDRIQGRIAGCCESETSISSVTKPLTNNIDREIELENLERIGKMSKQEIEKAKQEIMERFDPKILDFLRNRAKKKMEQRNAKEVEPIEMPRQTKKLAGIVNPMLSDVCVSPEQGVVDKIEQLEIFDLGENNRIYYKNSKTSTVNDLCLRLAADVAQMDMAAKCMRTILPRQQQNIIRLFDNLRTPPKYSEFSKILASLNYAGDDALLEKARANLNAIKGLYLEQRKDDDGNSSVQFAQDIDPLGNGAWMLSPIRKVLDVMQKDGKTAVQDLVIVRLTLFWTLLVMIERPTLYYAFSSPGEIYVRLAEIFMMGPEIFKDECVSQCLNRFLHAYLVPKAQSGLMRVTLKDSIANLDAFGPFYDDLLRHFEEFSLGDENFTLFILLGAYANQRFLDGLLMKCTVWSQERNIVRQMIMKKESGFGQLLHLYAAAIRNGVILKDRNELMYELALSELRYYTNLRMIKISNESDMESAKEYETLVCTLRQSLAGCLDFQLKELHFNSGLGEKYGIAIVLVVLRSGWSKRKKNSANLLKFSLMTKTMRSAMTSSARAASSGSSPTDSTSKCAATIKLRLLVSLLVMITMGTLCQLCQIICTSGNSTSKVAGLLVLFTAFFGHVWMSIHSCALTRARKAFFDESNVLETYQPRARTMGHLFCVHPLMYYYVIKPEPPTPAPTVKFSENIDDNKAKHSAEENAAFNALRDSHYANMFEYAMKMQKEMQAIEKGSNQSGTTNLSPTETSTQVSQSINEQSPSSGSSSDRNVSDKSSSENKEMSI